MAHFYKPPPKAKKRTSPVNRYFDSLTIERLSDDGRGIASVEGKTLFVEGALPGEQVSANVFSETARFMEAKVNAVVDSAAIRVMPQCGHYATCGACHMQHMSIASQHEFKQHAFLEKLKHWSGIEPKCVLPIIPDKDYRYRQRVRLSVMIRSGNISFGFRKRNSKQLVDVGQCPVMAPSLEVLLKPLKQWLNEAQKKDDCAVSHIEHIGSDDSTGIVIRHTKPLSLNYRELLQQQLTAFNAVCWFQGSKQSALTAVDGNVVDPRLFYTLPEYDVRLAYHPQDFVQANTKVNQKMVSQALALLQPQADERFLDLFCGIGNFSLPLSRLSKAVMGIEGVDAMVSRATENANNNINNQQYAESVKFLRADLFKEDSLTKALCGFDGIILDPPRAGAKMICENITKLMPKRIVYVSFDASTFARDAQLLCKNDYQLHTAGVMDMFPQTSHSEVMGLFIHSSWKR